MAFSFTRLGHVAANQWEVWPVTTPPTNKQWWYCAVGTGAVSGATAYIVYFGVGFTGLPVTVTFIRLNGTPFTPNETVNITGGGSFVIGAAASSTLIHPIVIVNGTDTVNLFDAVAQQSISAGWGYHSLTKSSQLILNCSVMLGTPDQAAVSSAISQLESVELNGNFYVAGNTTYNGSCKIGEGVMGDFGTSRLGCAIDQNLVAPDAWFGGTRYGYLEAHASSLNNAVTGWKCGFQRCEFWEVLAAGGSLQGYYNANRAGGDSADIMTVSSCSSAQCYGSLHDQLSVDGFYLYGVSASYGVIIIGPANYTVRNLTIENFPTHIFAFVANGTSYWINCLGIDTSKIGQYWSGTIIIILQFTIDIKCQNADGDALSGVRVRAYDGTQTVGVSTPLFDVTTAADGTITQQVFTYTKVQGSGTSDVIVTNYNPITLWIDQIGWREVEIVKTLSAPLDLTVTMEPPDPWAVRG